MTDAPDMPRTDSPATNSIDAIEEMCARPIRDRGLFFAPMPVPPDGVVQHIQAAQAAYAQRFLRRVLHATENRGRELAWLGIMTYISSAHDLRSRRGSVLNAPFGRGVCA